MGLIVIPIVLFLLGAIALLRLNAAAIAALFLVLLALVFGMEKIWTIVFVVLAIGAFSVSYFMKDEADFASKRATLDEAWKNIRHGLVTIWFTWRPAKLVEAASAETSETEAQADPTETEATEAPQPSPRANVNQGTRPATASAT